MITLSKNADILVVGTNPQLGDRNRYAQPGLLRRNQIGKPYIRKDVHPNKDSKVWELSLSRSDSARLFIFLRRYDAQVIDVVTDSPPDSFQAIVTTLRVEGRKPYQGCKYFTALELLVL